MEARMKAMVGLIGVVNGLAWLVLVQLVCALVGLDGDLLAVMIGAAAMVITWWAFGMVAGGEDAT